MKALRLILLLAGLLGGGAAQAQISTALELRLQSIEARLPDIGKLHLLEEKIQKLAGGGGIETSATAAGTAGGGTFSLLQDVQRLQEQVRDLRGEIESLRHLLERQEQGQRALYQDLDQRLRALAQTPGTATTATVGSATAPPAPDGAVQGDATAVKQAYLAAFEQLKQANYAAARTQFEDFIQTYPDSDYSDNAWYWLGQARYIDRRYDEALQAFNTVIERFPASGKTADSAYKIGVILDEQGKTEQARAQLRMVAEKYPQDRAGQLARQHLQAIGGN